MKKRILYSLFLLVSFLLIFNLVSADFDLENYSIKQEYAPENNLEGWVNISFDNEKTDNLIKGSSEFNGEIKLIDFLNENNADYSCNPNDCEANYELSNGDYSKSFSLNYGEEKIYGFKITGSLEFIESLSFNINVNNPLNCLNPLEINILDDDSTEWYSDKVTENYDCVYGEGMGCFNPEEDLNEVRIGNTPYCENITLRESEKFRLGAWVKKGSTLWADELLEMKLYTSYGEKVASCYLPEPSSTGDEVYCDVNYSNKKTQNYYVCIKADETTDYKLKTESENSCGFYGIPEPNEDTEFHDYYIFAKSASFDNIGEFVFNQTEYEDKGNSGNLVHIIENYIEDKYDSDCSEGCSVPIKFKSYADLDIEISGLSLSYATSGGLQSPEGKIYNAEKESALINSDFEKLYLSYSNISVPKEPDEYDLNLYVGNQKILDDIEIEVLDVPVIKSISPNIVAAAVLTEFTVNIDKPQIINIKSYKWYFGDNVSQETDSTSVKHIYDSIGNYNLEIEIEDDTGFKSSKIFEVIVKSPENLINSTITKYKERINNLSVDISDYPDWYGEIIKGKIGIGNLNDKIKTLETKYGSASDDEDYINIMKNLTEMRVPYEIKKSSFGEMPYFTEKEIVNLEYLKEFGAGNYNDTDSYKEAVAAWAENNLDLNLDFKYLFGFYDDGEENILNIYELDINKLGEFSNLYLIINGQGIKFDSENYDLKEFDDAFGIHLGDISTKKISFAVEDIKTEDLELYLSPEFNKLNIYDDIAPCNFNSRCEKDLGENYENCRSDCKPWGWVVFWILMILLAGLIVYILLQWWYKVRYESHLFEKRNDLFNILGFIENAGKQGLDIGMIKRKLKQSGWNREQINYALKKYKGKPLMPFDFLAGMKRIKNKFSKNKDLEKV